MPVSFLLLSFIEYLQMQKGFRTVTRNNILVSAFIKENFLGGQKAI